MANDENLYPKHHEFFVERNEILKLRDALLTDVIVNEVRKTPIRDDDVA